MSTALLDIAGLTKAYGAVIACDHVSLTIAPGEVHALIGPNGAGKTTLIAQIAGERLPDSGRIVLDGHDITRLPVHARARRGLGRSFQVASIFPRLSVLDNVALAVQAHAGHSFGFWRPARRDEALRGPARATLARVGLAARAEALAAALAHGEQRQLELAMALAGAPRLLLLDEPTAGMGPTDTARMIALLNELKGDVAILLVEHDMDAVFALADRISVMVYGRLIATGTPAAVRADPEVRRAYLGEDEVA
ncbi:MAG: ABC transporter ATP-binding protein [Alphaproteobacteria bacterium]|nr:MAG: ABC transporter ATP-binding protein [Alphaproteobacteria bacterium]